MPKIQVSQVISCPTERTLRNEPDPASRNTRRSGVARSSPVLSASLPYALPGNDGADLPDQVRGIEGLLHEAGNPAPGKPAGHFRLVIAARNQDGHIVADGAKVPARLFAAHYR